jgi:hypothetical protein
VQKRCGMEEGYTGTRCAIGKHSRSYRGAWPKGNAKRSFWRNAFHIKPADKFKRKFQEKYGPDALESFDMMIQYGVTLQEIGHAFGFSCEYARQVYNNLYHGAYRVHQRHRERALMAQ